MVGLLEAASQWPIVRVGAYDPLPALDAGSLVLACGKTNTTDAYITQAELVACSTTLAHRTRSVAVANC